MAFYVPKLGGLCTRGVIHETCEKPSKRVLTPFLDSLQYLSQGGYAKDPLTLAADLGGYASGGGGGGYAPDFTVTQ